MQVRPSVLDDGLSAFSAARLVGNLGTIDQGKDRVRQGVTTVRNQISHHIPGTRALHPVAVDRICRSCGRIASKAEWGHDKPRLSRNPRSRRGGTNTRRAP